MTDYINQIILGNAFYELPKLPSESINCVVTSPPYWGLRDYGIEPVIWDEGYEEVELPSFGNIPTEIIKIKCEHKWGDINITLKHKSNETNPGKEEWFKDKGASDDKGNCFCIKCGAWKGSLGLEPTFELYIKHLCDIFDKVKRILRKDGTCFVNIGDTYWGGGNNRGSTPENLSAKQFSNRGARGQVQNQWTKNYPDKSLCDIPYRFSIEMINRGWIKRNTIIWWKPNSMPSSAPDRFTVDFEYLFFFTKNNETLFWTNEKTLCCVDKQPLGTKGIEGIDWEWRPCPRCQGTGGETKIDGKDAERMGSPRARYHRITKQEDCKRCKGLGKIKYSFWTGHDYWFDQQFEKHKQSSLDRIKLAQKNKERYDPNKHKTDKEGKAQCVYEIMARVAENGGLNPQGRNKRCVWTIPTHPFPEAHFAIYPEALIETPIQAGCPRYVCKKCGKGRVKIYETKTLERYELDKKDPRYRPDRYEGKYTQGMRYSENKEIGYSDCGCNAGFKGGIVLDPFGGALTTCVVAKKQGKRYIAIEIKQEYIDMGKKRLKNIPESLF